MTLNIWVIVGGAIVLIAAGYFLGKLQKNADVATAVNTAVAATKDSVASSTTSDTAAAPKGMSNIK